MDRQPASKARILRFVYTCEGTSKSEIVRALGVSMPTVLQYLRTLREAGLLREDGRYASTGGRKASVIKGIPRARLAAGIEINKRHVSFVLVDLFCAVIAARRMELPFSADLAYCVALRAAFGDFLAAAETEIGTLLGVGIAIPGIVNAAENTVAFSHSLGVLDMSLDMLRGVFEIPCRFFRGADAAGRAELRHLDKDISLLYLSLSPTVGGSFFDGGGLYKGDHQRASIIGHTTLIPGGRVCFCGKAGCVAAYCASTVLSQAAGDSLDAFFALLEAGDAAIAAVWEEYLGYLAILITNLRMLYDCDIILGGYVGGRLLPYLPNLRERVAKNDLFDRHGAYLHVGHYQRRAAATGAAILLVDRFFDNEGGTFF